MTHPQREALRVLAIAMMVTGAVLCILTVSGVHL